jgi:hypothetical protein
MMIRLLCDTMSKRKCKCVDKGVCLIVCSVYMYIRGFYSASELYRSNGRRLSAELVQNFARSDVSRGQSNESPRSLISVS